MEIFDKTYNFEVSIVRADGSTPLDVVPPQAQRWFCLGPTMIYYVS